MMNNFARTPRFSILKFRLLVVPSSVSSGISGVLSTDPKDLRKKAGMKEWIAAVFRKAVEIGGSEILGLSFSWAFAYKGID